MHLKGTESRKHILQYIWTPEEKLALMKES